MNRKHGFWKKILLGIGVAMIVCPIAQASYFEWQKDLSRSLVNNGDVGTIYSYSNGQMVGIFDIPGGAI